MGDMSREPSMEEILSSIRRVIARDDSRRSAGLSPLRDQDVDDVDDTDEDGLAHDDILELTEASPSPGAAQPAPVADAVSLDEAASDSAAADGAGTQAAAPAVDAPLAPPLAAPPLVSPVSAAASRQSLDTLAALLASGSQAPAADAGDGSLTVNALVEAALRPMLKQWLDANLPNMVESLVSREIARITGQRL